jgi:hypothetical protein
VLVSRKLISFGLAVATPANDEQPLSLWNFGEAAWDLQDHHRNHTKDNLESAQQDLGSSLLGTHFLLPLWSPMPGWASFQRSSSVSSSPELIA